MTRLEVWQGAGRVLCVRLDALGDVLMTTPAICALKESTPGRHITLLTSPAGAAVARLVPEIDEVLVYEAPWMKATPSRASSGMDRSFVENLRQGRFDAAIIFTVYSQNPLPAALYCYLADTPLRLAHCRENPYQLLTDWVPDPEPCLSSRHETRRQLELVAAVGCRTARERLSLRVPPQAHDRVKQLLYEFGLEEGPAWILIHPGASAPSRRYPPELFAEVADRLILQCGGQIVFTGTADERDLVHQVQGLMTLPSHSLAGCLDLGELAALIEQAPLLIANNTGPVHVAAAVGTPVVVLYALTNPQHTPWMVPHRVLSYDVPCRYCYKSVCPEGHHHCLRLVSPQEVVNAAQELLSETARACPQAAVRAPDLG
jgi:lipopolysaccharide heptosyltransferase II